MRSRTPSSASRISPTARSIVYDEDIEALVDDEIGHAERPHQGRRADRDRRHEGSADGDADPRHRRATPDQAGDRQRSGRRDLQRHQGARAHEATLELYQVHAVTEGTDAQAEVSVRLAEDGSSVTGRGADPDTLVASARAYVAALNKLIVKRLKGKPEPMVADVTP